MNPDWITFLKYCGAIVSKNQHIEFPGTDQVINDKIFPVIHLAVIKIAGSDAANFLQGQVTCNINDLDENKASIAAFCNVKGRVISTLLIIKRADDFIVLLPRTLTDKVIKKLSMYVLRSDVQITDQSDRLCLLGINCSSPDINAIKLPEQAYQVSTQPVLCVRLPGAFSRYLLVSSNNSAIEFWNQVTSQKTLHPGDSEEWTFQDLSAGIPWFDEVQSEQYIPQMINMDKLDGISLNKGCYTGQEIVARTHYLGKAKREMYLAECSKTAMLKNDSEILNISNNETIGKVLSFQNYKQKFRLLIIMQTIDNEQKKFILKDSDHNKIHIISFQ